MTLKTELPTNLLLPLTTIQQKPKNILPTRIYHQLKYILPMRTNFPPPFPCQKKTSLWQRGSKVYKYISKIKCISTFYLRIGVLQHKQQEHAADDDGSNKEGEGEKSYGDSNEGGRQGRGQGQ